MGLRNPSNGESQSSEYQSNGGESLDPPQPQSFFDEIDSNCSTPYVSAPSSPGRGGHGGCYFFSAPASPMHYVLSSSPYTSVKSTANSAASDVSTSAASFEFEFSGRFSSTASAAATGSMISADELFFNGQIRPMKLSSHLQRPQALAPLLDLEMEEEDQDEEAKDKKCGDQAPLRGRDLSLRSRSLHRRARSMSPLRTAPFQWHDDEEEEEEEEEIRKTSERDTEELEIDSDPKRQTEETATPSDSASSSRSSSTSGRNSKRWIFLKDLLYRSKSEGRENGKEKFWYTISFSPSKEKNEREKSSSLFSRVKTKDRKAPPAPPSSSEEADKSKQRSGQASSIPKKTAASSKPTNGVGKRRVPAPSPHERHYAAKRAQAEEMRRKTFLPYRQGLLGCLGFSSRSYSAMNGFAKTLNPVSSR